MSKQELMTTRGRRNVEQPQFASTPSLAAQTSFHGFEDDDGTLTIVPNQQTSSRSMETRTRTGSTAAGRHATGATIFASCNSRNSNDVRRAVSAVDLQTRTNVLQPKNLNFRSSFRSIFKEENVVVHDLQTQIRDLQDKFNNLYFQTMDNASHASSNNNKYLEAVTTLMSRQSKSELPKFDGNPENWPMFSFEYYRSTKECRYSEGENVSRLRNALKGVAYESVTALLIMPNSSERIMDILERRFGRDEYIIKAYIAKTRAILSPRDDRPLTIIEFATAVENLTTMLELLNRQEYMINPTLLTKIQIHENPNFDLRDFANWIDKKSHGASRRATLYDPNFKIAQKKETKTIRVNALSTQAEHKVKCSFCQQSCERLKDCSEFLKVSVDERWKFVTDKRLCFSCLRSNHATRNCKHRNICSIDSCQRIHNQLLHKEKLRVNQVTEGSLNVANCAKIENIIVAPKFIKQKTTLRILPVILKNGFKELLTYALLDSGSDTTLLNSQTATELGLAGQSKPLMIKWANGDVAVENDSSVVSLQIKGVFSAAKIYKLNNVRTVSCMPLQAQSIDKTTYAQKWPYLAQADFDGYENQRPTILIGEDNGLLTATRELLHGEAESPIARRTLLGWVVSGNHGRVCDNSTVCHIENIPTDNDLNELVKQSFRLDENLTRKYSDNCMSKEDQRALKIMEKTAKQTADGRWEIGLLWKNDSFSLPESKLMATRRLEFLERRLDRDPELKAGYQQIIDDYIDKGYLNRVSKPCSPNLRMWFLPHFPVLNPMKPGKIRIVFDAASKSNGICLNDALVQGPDLLEPLPSVLYKFRQGRFGFIGDIQEMFHRVKIRADDSNSQLILWRQPGEDKPAVYKMSAMMFGAKCSPSCAIYIKNKNAEQFDDKFGPAVKAIKFNHYMDDYLGSADTIDEAQRLIADVAAIHHSGGFLMRNWCSSSAAILNNVPTEFIRADKSVLIDKSADVNRALGIRWNLKEDEFTFSTNFVKIDDILIKGSKIPTKREVLKIVMSIYDPLGFVAHFTVVGRILLQRIWRTEIDWDTELPYELQPDWFTWLNDLQKISHVKIKRCYSTLTSRNPDIQLHTFVDASEEAYAAVSYFRIECENKVEVVFVSAKAKVSPLKPITIPRLELQSALTGSRLANAITRSHDLHINRKIFWSDSTTVLQWLRADARRFKQYVSHRLGEIAELTDIAEWRWIPSKENIADDATRSRQKDFDSNCRWFRGPEFLRFEESMWSQKDFVLMTPVPTIDMAEINIITTTTHNKVIPDANRFSNWFRLGRTIAWVTRFVFNLTRNNKERLKGELTVEELDRAVIMIIRQSQHNSFKKEIAELMKNQIVDKSSRLYKLTPILDADGLLRISGRLNKMDTANLQQKQPIILDGKDDYTRLLMKHYHCFYNHMGHFTVLNEIRQKYWIIRAKTTLKKIANDCQHCKIQQAKPMETIMADLPRSRLAASSPPFSFTGMDCFGPLFVRVGRRHEKRYGVLFTCMTIRAVHIEIAHDLSTDACLMALRRFISRRGCPQHITSDNGTNFCGAKNEIHDCIKEIDKDEVLRFMTTHRIKWTFNPPASPHMGGVWERLIRSTKNALYATLKERFPTDEMLLTLLSEVEHILNSPPLVEVSEHPEDGETLTPNHFLIGRSSQSAPMSQQDDKDLLLRKRWRAAQRLADYFWTIWIKSFMPGLNRRTKWFAPGRKPTVGDLVLVIDNNLPRGVWVKGIVTKLYPGSDNEVRVVDIRTATSTYRRPITKLCLLDVKRVYENRPDLNTGPQDVTNI